MPTNSDDTRGQQAAIELTKEDLLDVLKHLRHPDHLGSMPLAQCVFVTMELDRLHLLDDEFHRGLVLSDLVEREIRQHIVEELTPTDLPLAARMLPWFVLHRRFVFDLTGPEVAKELGVSQREVFRHQDAGLSMLARAIIGWLRSAADAAS